MSNKTITNKQSSIVSLAPLLDTSGNVLVLQPKGMKGDEKTIDAETAADEIVDRICKAGWAHVRSAHDAAAQPPQQPASTPPPLPPAPEPEPAAPTPETTAVMPPADVEALAEESKPPFETSLPTETPSSSETSTPPSRTRRR